METSLAILIFFSGLTAFTVAYTKSQSKENPTKRQEYSFPTKGITVWIGVFLLLVSVIINAYSIEIDATKCFVGNIALEHSCRFLVALIPLISGMLFNEIRRRTSRWREPTKKKTFLWLSLACLAQFAHSLAYLEDVFMLLVYLFIISIWLIYIKAQED